MSTALARNSAVETPLPFPSLSALRDAHSELLKEQPEEDESTPQFVAAVEEFLERGQETGALLDSLQDRWSAQSTLNYWATTLYCINRKEIHPVLAEFDPLLAPELPESLCPYVGLEAFHESDREMFFGRSRLIGEMVSCLKENRLVAALGPSGSGKSSLVLGGLLPALKSGALPGSEGWLYLPPMMPGSEPLKNLAHALRPAPVDPAQLAQDPPHLARLMAERGDQPAVLVIDQFEEVFTLCEDSQVRQAFIANLLGLLRAPEPQHRVILTMRSDYEAFMSRQEELQPFFEKAQLRVTPLSAAELRDAIEKPAERVGLKFEGGVVPDLLESILGEPAGLPLLQFTLFELWKSRKRNRVTWKDYKELKGDRGALATSANRLYDNLIPEEQVTAKRILLRMVRPGEGLEVTSSRIRRAALSGEDPGRIARVLDKLVKARLVRLTKGETADDDQVEVAHEALIRNWPRLVEWLQEARAQITTRRRWEIRADEWVRLGRGPGGLLDEVQLAEVERWMDSPEAKELGHNKQLDDLVEASREAVDKAKKEKRWRAQLKWMAVAIPLLYLVIAAVLQWRAQAVNDAKVEAQTEVLKLYRQTMTHLRKVNEHVSTVEIEAQERQRTAKLQAAQKIRQAEIQVQQAQQRAAEADKATKQSRLKAQGAQADAEEARRQVEIQNKASEDLIAFVTAQVDAILEANEQQQRAMEEQILKSEIKRADELNRVTERTRQLESEIADGGDGREETLTELLGNMGELIGQRLDQRRFRKNHRPVRAGTSVSTEPEKSLPGTICCVVHDSEGKYLLSRASVFGEPGAAIVQPSAKDGMGGKLDIVAEVVRRERGNPNRAAAIARVPKDSNPSPFIPRFGGIVGTKKVKAGDEIRQVGRGSGIQKGRVLRVEEDGTIVTDIRPAPGDTGGPVLTPGRELVGMLWGWSKIKKESYVAPIEPILDDLDVGLVVAVKK
ncbi:MAG TPA: hypothetical protein VF756_30445 [Thermoanaerobaculia bacterium]